MANGRSDTEQGVQFPLVDGRRSTQATGKRVFASAVRFVDASLADRIETAQNWRKTYLHAVRQTVELGVRSPKNALRIASDGLDEARSTFTFERDGDSFSLDEAFERSAPGRFRTEVVEGQAARATELVIPYRGEDLRGDHLRGRLERWRSEGRIEPSAAHAVASVVDNPEWLDLRDVRVALLGAASEMGPLEQLTSWGADILAVDLPKRNLWERILRLAREGAGRIRVPVSRDVTATEDLSAAAGADLLTDTPEIMTWLATLASDAPFVLGNYAYAPGAVFVMVAVAVDAIAGELAGRGHLAGYAYLASPTEVYAVPRDTVEAAGTSGAGARVLRAASGGRVFVPNYEKVVESEGRERGIFDCLVPQQGPNYALAKSLHRWSSLTMRDAGVVTSANVAPATRTISVMKNRALAAAYAGARPFGVEVFEPATSRALMAALLVADLRDPQSAARPDKTLDHPYDLFAQGAAHGGLWRMRHAPRTVLPLAVVLGFPRSAFTRKA
ncbi:MAG: hypothetical protein M3285_08780 [Actinomycetota bacterium]|nr:hypothetical protein [Actinomycetota bacterium]